MLKKISVNKSDEAALIVEKIIETETDEVVLIIPRFSHLAESLENFHLLKREAEAIDKKILIESVDNRVVELAELAGIEAINPFFVKNKKQFSDIIPKKNSPAGEIKKSHVAGDWQKEGEFLEQLSDEAYGHKEIDVRRNIARNDIFKKEKQRESMGEEEKMSLSERFPIKTVVALVVLGITVYAAVAILPKADLKIVTKKIDWVYNDSVVTQLSAKANSAAVTIPNQKFTSTQGGSYTMSFPATGKKQVSNKAAGKITVYNAYSSDPQPLVQNTRFMSPDGKIFLLTKNITVPAAKISEGKIIPSSIDADVIAEKAGADYNIAPVKLFTIPGFKGGPKYSAFYGESKDSMSGGFVGEIAYPTPADIASASQKIADTLKSNLETNLSSQISSEFIILKDASSFSILKQDNNTNVDKDGKFSITASSQMTILAFKEADLISVLKQKAEADNGGNYEMKSHDIQYGIARMNVGAGQLSFPVNFKAVLSYKIDVANLKKEIAGKPDIELRKTIFSLPGLDTANVSLWPFWVKSVPTNVNKINIVID